ncbi:MAG: bifunctional DNase/RNase [Phycisphaerales bacterium]|jgi:bifunctional DNase/RNase
MAVRMQLSRILIRELVDFQIIELREMLDDGETGETGQAGEARTFPIVIGLPEAQAIERRLSGITIKRPQTHDLLGSIIREMGGHLEKIEITDLSEHTFFAELEVLRDDGSVVKIDSRPSDAIALGIATGTPIWVAEHVLESATAPDYAEDEEDDSDEDEGYEL